jgi:hypothetical protein
MVITLSTSALMLLATLLGAGALGGALGLGAGVLLP